MFYYINEYVKYDIKLCKAFINVNNLTKFQWFKLYFKIYTYAIFHYKRAKQHVLDCEYIYNYYKKQKEKVNND